jgi:hypothetical protein
MMTVNIERIDKSSDIAECHAHAANLTLQLQPIKAVESLRHLPSSNPKQYLISQFEVREFEI